MDVSSASELNDSAQLYHDKSDFTSAMKFALKAKSLAEDLNLSEELATAYLMIGNVKMREGHLNEAKQNFTKSLNIAKQINHSNLEARSLSSVATILSQLGKYDSAELLINETLDIANNDKAILISSYGRLGANYKRQHLYDNAIDFYLKSLAISQDIRDSLASARTLANIGNIYYEQKDFNKALDYFLKSLVLLDSSKHKLSISGISVFASDTYMMLGNLTEAEKYLNRALKLVEELHLPASEAYATESLGILKFKQGKFDESIEYLNKALAIQRTLDSPGSLESILLEIAEYHIHQKQFDKSEAALAEAKSIADQLKNPFFLKQVYSTLSQLDSAKGDFQSALLHYKKSVLYRDTLFNLEKTKAIEELNSKFQVQQKEKTISEQKQLIERQQAKEIFFIILISIVIVAGIVIYTVNYKRQKNKHQFELEQQRKQKLLDVVIAQERIQQKIARDLHDGLAQILGAAKISLESAKTIYNSKTLFDKIQDTAAIIDRACDDTRTISHQLLPYSLEKHGLVIALQTLLEKLPKKDYEVYEFKHNLTVTRFKDTIEINLYRIAQELINNIVKHANANKIMALLTQQAGNLILSIHDNGKGFDTSTTPSGAGFMNMESRLQVIRGTMRIESKPKEGTTVIVSIPVMTKDNGAS